MPTAADEPLTIEAFREAEAGIRLGGGAKAVARQHGKGRLTARERVAALLDPLDDGSPGRFFELGLWAAWGMYAEHGGCPAAGVVTGIGRVADRPHMIIANDATVKAGAFFPMTAKKVIRAQTVAAAARLPLIYLVDSAGVYLPLQEDVFPDTDDFGRIFRHNAVMSAAGVPQTAAIMGACVAGGGYLPVLCDVLLMTEGSGLYLAGPALVKAAIGQDASDEELGGAAMHAQISGTVDFREPDDASCLRRVRELAAKRGDAVVAADATAGAPPRPVRPASDLVEVHTDKPGAQYDVRDLLACVVDARAAANGDGHETLGPDLDEYRAEHGRTIVCAYARLGGRPVGIVANQKSIVDKVNAGGKAGPSTTKQMPGVIYDDAADKAARFIMDVNQRGLPLVFVHDTTGFMVGRDSEQGGIIRAGAKLVNAMSNAVVPKVVLITGGSYGAGNYAMCGRAFDPFLTLAWPTARCAVMGAAQATGTLAMIEERARERRGEALDPETRDAILGAVRASYTEQQDIRYAAARLWVDRLIEPERTREELIAALEAADHFTSAPLGIGVADATPRFATGVIQT